MCDGDTGFHDDMLSPLLSPLSWLIGIRESPDDIECDWTTLRWGRGEGSGDGAGILRGDCIRTRRDGFGGAVADLCNLP